MRSKIICNYSTFHRAGKRLPSREVSGTGITLGSLDVHGNSCLSLRVTAERNGVVSAMDTMRLGYIAQGLGAGRRTKEDVIDPGVGFIMRARLGDQIRAGDPLAEIHARNEDDYEQAAAAIRDTVRITEEAPAAHPLIYAAVTREGTRIMQ